MLLLFMQGSIRYLTLSIRLTQPGSEPIVSARETKERPRLSLALCRPPPTALRQPEMCQGQLYAKFSSILTPKDLFVYRIYPTRYTVCPMNGARVAHPSIFLADAREEYQRDA